MDAELAHISFFKRLHEHVPGWKGALDLWDVRDGTEKLMQWRGVWLREASFDDGTYAGCAGVGMRVGRDRGGDWVFECFAG